MHFRHVRLSMQQQRMLVDLQAARGALIADTVNAGQLTIDPSLPRGPYEAPDLAALARYELVEATEAQGAWRVRVTPFGRDYLEETVMEQPAPARSDVGSSLPPE